MISRRLVFLTSIAATAASFFTLGILHARRTDVGAQQSYDAQIAALRAEIRSELGRSARSEAIVPAATVGRMRGKDQEIEPPAAQASRAKMVAEIKQELQSEMGLLPVHLLRDRRS